MPVYLSTAVLGNDDSVWTLGHSGEVMAAFWPHKDHAQHVHECIPAVYLHGQNRLLWTWSDEFTREQAYEGAANILVTRLFHQGLQLEVTLRDVVPHGADALVRQVELSNRSGAPLHLSLFFFGDWNMGGIAEGNALRFDALDRALVQNHREAAIAVGGSALEQWSCGKVGDNWGSNSKRDMDDGRLACNNLEIGDVCWSFGFEATIEPHHSLVREAAFALAANDVKALALLEHVLDEGSTHHLAARRAHDEAHLQAGRRALDAALGSATLPSDLRVAYERSLSCLPLLCGREGVAVAAPEFDFEFISCGGYGYFWPRDGGEFVSGLIDSGYSGFAEAMFDWCARHQDASGLWHQRYFLNGAPGPNWCLPPDHLQIDQVGAVLWAFGKWRKYLGNNKKKLPAKKLAAYKSMVEKAADYLLTRLTEKGVHGNAFDTWETFVGSFTYSNAAIYSALKEAGEFLGDDKYLQGAQTVKDGVLRHFVRERNGHKCLVRGLDSNAQPDEAIDSSSLGAIEPFELLDLSVPAEFELARGTLKAMREALEVDWMGGRAIRRFEGDAYVGGVPACVNTLWMARCSLRLAKVLRERGEHEEAREWRDIAQLYLQTVLRRATPTGLLPELMQGPTGQAYWAAPHGWAMSSFVSGVLELARQS
jgi:glucoamylase